MFSLILYYYSLQKNDKIYQNIGFLFNLEQIPRSSKKGLRYLGVKVELLDTIYPPIFVK